MNDAIIVALIGALASIIGSIISGAILWKQRAMHLTFNSKMDGALQAQRSLGAAEGRLDEKADQKIRDAESGLTKSEIEETVHK